jgi:hypothetical protein
MLSGKWGCLFCNAQEVGICLTDCWLTWTLTAGPLEDLRWYLEDYLLAPYGVWEERGPAIREKLAGWGELVFGSVFADGPARFA